MSELEAVRQEIAELTRTIKGRARDATIDTEKIVEELKELMNSERVAAAEEKLNRRGEPDFEDVGPDGQKLPKHGLKKALQEKRVVGGKFDGQKLVDLEFARHALDAAHRYRPAKAAGPSEELVNAIERSANEVVKAAMSTTDAVGGDLTPQAMAQELWEDFFLEARIMPLFAPVINMPSDPFDAPFWGEPTWYKGSEGSATTAEALATDQKLFTTTEQVAEIDWSYTLDEDAVIAMLPNLRKSLRNSGARQMDKFILNADGTDAGTGNINLDDADPDSDAYYLSDGQDGLRHLWLVDNTDQAIDAGGDALTQSDLLSMFSAMDKYGLPSMRAAMITDVQTYINGLMNLDAVQTLDKLGNQAVIMTGQLASIYNVPIIVSEGASLTEADGKVSATGSNNTLGQITCVNRDMWGVGVRRQLLIEVDKDIQTRQMILVASFRIAVASRNARASAKHTAGIYNILVS